MNLIQMTHGSDTPLVLHGAAVAAPFRGAAFTPLGDPLGESKERGRSPYIDEVIELVLENNSPAAIAAGFSGIEYFLQLAKEQAATGIGKPAYLDCIGAPGDASYRSQIFDGWLETAGGERTGGSVGLRLHLARASFWEASDELPLKLALPGQASTFSELTLYNHRDSDMGHTNLFQVLGADAAGDLPAAARLEIRNINTGTMRNFFLSADHHPNVGGTYRFFDTNTLDSQFESGGTYSADGTCTYGSKNTHSWAGAGETVLGSWALTALSVAPCQGRTYKPVLRLPGGSGYADLWLRFRIKDGGGYVIWDGPYALLPTSVELVDLAPIPLPPNLAEV
ncbi:MAG TPA: hypothetical protein VF813_06985, partial [Anaerolineaceae bacterium]